MKQPNVLFPPSLKPKGTVGFVSPGRWPDSSWINKAKAFLEGKGYQVVVHAQNYLKEGQQAGIDAARAEAVMDMFIDSTIDAVMCTSGGPGVLDILDKLDYDIIRENPKPLIGFASVTALLQAVTRQSGFVTYHGPMGWNFAQPGHDSRTGVDLLNVIGNRRKHCRLHYPDVECLHPGRAEGVLVGGNITMLQHLVGTPFDWQSKGAILFIEDTDIPLYRIDQMLGHLRLAGKLEGLQAVMVGGMEGVVDSETPFAREGEKPFGSTLQEIVQEHVTPGLPLAFNFPCGHGSYITTLPVGASVQLSLSARGAEITYTAPPAS